MAAPESGFRFTPLQVEYEISKTLSRLSSLPRFNPHRPARLNHLVNLRHMRNGDDVDRKDYHDKSITYLTEAVLLPSQPSQAVVRTFFVLAARLYARFRLYGQPEDLKYSAKYFRFLRYNFHSVIPRDRLTPMLVQTLADTLISSTSDTTKDMTQEMEEMTVLVPELVALARDISTHEIRDAITTFCDVITVTEAVSRKDTQLPERLIHVLREAMALMSDSRVSCALASCLAARFRTTHVINDYEEAVTIADKIVASSAEDTLTPTQENAISLILILVVSRMNCYTNPEYLEDSIDRLRALLRVPALPKTHKHATAIVYILDYYMRQRSNSFGTGKTPSNPGLTFIFPWIRASESNERGVGLNDDFVSQMLENLNLLNGVVTAISGDEIIDVEVAVERGRALLPPPHLRHLLSHLPVVLFADILFRAYARTGRPDYLNEAITTYRDLRKVSTPKAIHFAAGSGLILSLLVGLDLFSRLQDYEEAMQLFPMVAGDESGEVLRRFDISCRWAHCARRTAHSSTPTAYETAMSLMQEILVFSPTLQIQHLRLANALESKEGLPSDYASYQIVNSRHKQAIETLERGRALLWSEMRGLRTSTDQLHGADPASADKFTAINRELESVTMSIAQTESEEMVGGEPGRREWTDSIGRLVTTQRRLLGDRDTLISHIQSLPGFENFLKPLSFDALNAAAARGPVIIINQSPWCSDIIILHKDLPPSIIATPSDFYYRANRLEEQLLRVRKERGVESKDYGHTLASVLADLYKLVGKQVVERLHELKIPERSRVWWCPTAAFCSLPLHAMGPIPSDRGEDIYFLDMYIPSYTPTLSALVESRKPGSLPETFAKPSLLLVAQPKTLFGAWDEIGVIQSVGTPVTTLVSAMATPKTVVEGLRNHSFVHFVCHGLLETGKPFDASFELHGDGLTLLKIVRSQLPAAEFAFLAACHTAELTEGSISDEGLHLAAAMQYCGFRSVVGTMWAMADTDGADLSKYFYKAIFSESMGRKQAPYYERSARALQFAMKKLRRKRGITLERWVNFVHYGA